MDKGPDTAISVPLRVLLAKMDAILTAQGRDPSAIAQGDKILLAVQYVEVVSIEVVLTTRVAEGMYRL